MNDIMTNSVALDVFCADIIEVAKKHYESDRDSVDWWVENQLIPAIEGAL